MSFQLVTTMLQISWMRNESNPTTQNVMTSSQKDVVAIYVNSWFLLSEQILTVSHTCCTYRDDLAGLPHSEARVPEPWVDGHWVLDKHKHVSEPVQHHKYSMWRSFQRTQQTKITINNHGQQTVLNQTIMLNEESQHIFYLKNKTDG